MEESKEQVKHWEEKIGDNQFKEASFAKVLNKGKKQLGDEVWVESESGEVLSNLGFLKKCQAGRWDGSLNWLPALDTLNL